MQTLPVLVICGLAAAALACSGGESTPPASGSAPESGSAARPPAGASAPAPAPSAAPKPRTDFVEQREGDDYRLSGKTEQGLDFEGQLGGEIEVSLPDDVPVYPGAEPASSLSLGKQHVVVFDIAGDADELAKFYKSELATEGWDFSGPQTSQLVEGGKKIAMRAGKEGRTLVASIEGEGDRSRLTLSVDAP